MNSSMAGRYPRLDSGQPRLSSRGRLAVIQAGETQPRSWPLDLGDFRLACLPIPAASKCGWPRAYAAAPARRYPANALKPTYPD
jgi:hypothetical protein